MHITPTEGGSLHSTAFAWMKCTMRRAPNASALNIAAAGHAALAAITGDLAASWFTHCGYTVV